MKKTAVKPMDSGDARLDDLWPDGPPSSERSSNLLLGLSEPAADPLSVNALLHSQLQALRGERAALSAALTAARAEHTAAERQWEAERRDLCGGGSDAAAARIMELARRQRHLTAELEAERARCRRLEARLTEPAPARTPSEPETAGAEPPAESPGDPGETPAQLRDRLRDTTRRLVEARNQAGAARRELRQAERLLQQEVGDGASLQQLLAAGSGWRGRAQQIVTLKAQLQELQAPTGAADDGTAATRSEPRLSAADSRARSHLRSLGREQQVQARQAAAEAEQQARETAALRLKLDATRSRAAVLTQETTQLREQTGRLSDKCRNDDEMIEVLESQVRRLEAELTDSGRAAACDARQAAAPVCGEQLALLRAQLTAREAEVARLERQLAARSAPEEQPPRSPSPPPPSPGEEVPELRRRCLEADFAVEAAAAERRRLAEALRELQTRLGDAERRAEAAAAALAEERQAATVARREAERLRQMLGRGRRAARPAGDGAGAEPELALLREELERVREEMETQRGEREQDLQRYEETMEEAREIFCRGLREAQHSLQTGTTD